MPEEGNRHLAACLAGRDSGMGGSARGACCFRWAGRGCCCRGACCSHWVGRGSDMWAWESDWAASCSPGLQMTESRPALGKVWQLELDRGLQL